MFVGVAERTAVRWEAGEQISADDALILVQRLEPYLKPLTLDWLYRGIGDVPRRTDVPIPDPAALRRLDSTYMQLDDMLREAGLHPYRQDRPPLLAIEGALQSLSDEKLRTDLHDILEVLGNLGPPHP